MLALSNALVGGLLAGCTGSSPALETEAGTAGTTTDTRTADETTTDAPETPTERVVTGNANFAFDLLDRLSETSPNENLFCSPYSVSVALAMTYAGARGETRREMRETLHFPAEGVHRGFRRLQDHFSQYEAPATTGREVTETTESDAPETTEKYREPEPFRLAGANALWGQSGFPFAESFLGTLERNYGAGLRELDFESNPERARRTINEWVADQTRGKITDLLSPSVIDAMTRLVLTNAVYFRANWEREFREEATADETFTTLSGAEQTVPMMSQSETFRYASVEGHQLVALPYAGGDASMVVLLPEAGAFEAFQRSLSAERLRELLGAMESRQGTVKLPRFGYRSKFDLSETLAEMGMTSAFGSEANLTGMARDDAGEALSIDEVVHQSYVSVDEQGTEAAAATAVVVAESATTVSEDPFEMTADRPFLFLIRDDETGTVLFLGRVTDAGAARDEA
jgi:serpin B